MKEFISEIFFAFRKKGGTTAFTSLSMQLASVAFTLLINLFLARIMLPPQFGAFAYASTLIFVLGNLGTFGTPNLVLKETGAAKDSASYIKKVLDWSMKRSGIFVLLILSGFIFISLQFNLFFAEEKMREFRTPMLVSLACVPLLSFLYILQSFLQGRGKIFSALFSEKILKSVLFITVSFIIYIVMSRQPLSFTPVAVINLASFFIAVLIDRKSVV